jgi:hypothetical protein
MRKILAAVHKRSSHLKSSKESRSGPSATLELRADVASSHQPESKSVAPPPLLVGPQGVDPSPEASSQTAGSRRDPAALHILDQALDALKEDERDTIKEYTPSGSNPKVAFDATYREAEKQKEKYDRSAFVWTVRDHKVELRVLANNVVKFLDKFKEFGDLLSRLDPVHAGLPWAGLKILLEVR